MEMNSSLLLGSLLIAVLAVATTRGLPTDDARMDESSLSAAKRPKYMDTREDFDVLKQTVYLAIQELVEEGKLEGSILKGDQNKVEKRMYMGICMRQSHNHFIPYPCMRNGRK